MSLTAKPILYGFSLRQPSDLANTKDTRFRLPKATVRVMGKGSGLNAGKYFALIDMSPGEYFDTEKEARNWIKDKIPDIKFQKMPRRENTYPGCSKRNPDQRVVVNAEKKRKTRNPKIPRDSGKVKPGRRGNPNRIPAQLAEKARRFFKVTHWGIDAKSISDIEIEIPDALVLLGELTEVSYLTKKGVNSREVVEWNHQFEKPFPKLYTTPDGKGLFIHGGNFKITRAGIEG